MIATKATILGLLGTQPYKEVMLVDNQETRDIIQAILAKHESCQADYDKFAYLFDGGNVVDICHRLFDFCRENIAYIVEPTKQQYTSKPGTILRRGTGDCKSYALFCGGVLDALSRNGHKINWAFRFASYNIFKKEPYHVFIVVTTAGQEIYIDPVFKTFNYKKPAMWVQDYSFSNKPARIAGMCLDCHGKLNVLSDGDMVSGFVIPHEHQGIVPETKIGTASSTGALIMKVAPSLAVIPVVGWATIAVLEVGGFFLEVFGDKYPASATTGLRWLAQMFDYLVKGEAGVTSDSKVAVSDIVPAQNWFSYVLGVPIYDKYRFFALRGQNGDTGASLGISQPQMVANYLAYQEVIKAGVTEAQAMQASTIALSLPYNTSTPPGAWAGMLAAPSVIAAGAQAAAAAPATSTSTVASLFSNKWVLIGLVAVGALLIFSED